MGYKTDAIKGISWMSAFRIITRALSFIKTVVLARVLNPAQFGVFGIASLILALLEMLTESGINIFLVQSKREIREYLNSAWVVSILRGIIICLLIIASSPLISSFFRTPAALPVMLTISLVPLIRGFINPAVVQFQKNLDFQKEFWFRTGLFFVDASVSIIFSIMTQSVFSLVWGLMAGAILEVILSFILIKPIPRFSIEKEYFSEIFHKGKWVTAFGIFNYIAQEGDNAVVGRMMGTPSLGIYQMAYKIATLPISEVTDVVSKVVFPVYARIGGDLTRLKSAFLKSTLAIIVSTVIMGTFIFVFAQEIVYYLLGNAWITAVPVLKVLAIFGVLRAISGSASSLFLGVGKQQFVTLMTAVRFLGLMLTIFPLVQTYGLVGAGYAALFSVIIEIPVILYFIYKIFSLKASEI